MDINEAYFAQALAWSIRTDFSFAKWLIDVRSFPEEAIKNPYTKALYRAVAQSYGKLAPRNALPTVNDVVLELSSIINDDVAREWGRKMEAMSEPSTSQSREIANAIAEAFDRELVMATVEDWLTKAQDKKTPIYKQFAAMSDRVTNILVGERRTGRPKDILEAAWASRLRVPESTGYGRLDEALDGGWTASRFYMWGMPSGHGKTSMCCNFTSRRAERELPSVLNSLEMPAPDMLFRMISDIAEVPIIAAENPDGGAQSLEEYERIMKARDLLDAYVRIYDMQADAAEMERRLRRHKAEFRDKTILMEVDHIGIMERGSRGNDWAELESMAYGFSNIAKLHEVPLLCFSQVPYDVELELLNNNMVIHHRDYRGSRGLRNAIDYGFMGCKHSGIIKNQNGQQEYDYAYRNHTVIQCIKNRRTGRQFWGVFRYVPEYYRLLNTRNEDTKEDIFI